MEVCAPVPVSREQLLLAHSEAFVDGVLEGRLSNGFGNRSLEVAASLPYTCGSMLSAAEQALINGKGAVAPCSGFHHAGYDFGGGFCTFNGLMVTALSLLQRQKVKRVAILDLDMHYGNGTQDIIDTLGVSEQVKHWSRSFSPSKAEQFLCTRINALVTRPLGVTMEQLIKELEVSRATINRDIELLRSQLNTPIVWDHETYSYRLDRRSVVGDRYMLPGVWLTPEQAYAFLTLNNMVEQMAPSLLGPFLEPMRGMLKEMLCQAQFSLFRLNEKIEIDMPGMPALNDQTFTLILTAVVNDQALALECYGESDNNIEIQGMPKRLRITSSGWTLFVQTNSGQERAIDMATVVKARLLKS